MKTSELLTVIVAEKSVAEILPLSPARKNAFKELNLDWIRQYFRVEKKDVEQTEAPEDCLRGGGMLFFVEVEGRVAGTCAMYKVGADRYELAKMAVDREMRGHGFGDELMGLAERWARDRGAGEILILSSTVLEPAIRLYQKHGYETMHLGPHPDYERCNIEMRKKLK